MSRREESFCHPSTKFAFGDKTRRTAVRISDKAKKDFGKFYFITSSNIATSTFGLFTRLRQIMNSRLIRVVSTYCFLFIVKKCLKALDLQGLFLFCGAFRYLQCLYLVSRTPQNAEKHSPRQGVVPSYR